MHIVIIMMMMMMMTVPVVIGALDIVKEGLDKYVERIPGSINITELQKITVLGTAHILRKVLSIK